MINFVPKHSFKIDIKAITDNFITSGFNHTVPPTDRLINKDGSYSVRHVDHPNAFSKHFRNGFQHMLKIKWRYVWVILFAIFPLTWSAFALVFYSVSYWHGDFDETYLNNTNYSPCIANSYGYLSMFLFSVENQETIGYGFRYITEECPVVMFFVMVQIVAGAILKVCFGVIIWVRMLRPKRRGEKVIFSEKACVYLNEEKKLCLAFRISDIDGTHLAQSCIRLYVALKQRLPPIRTSRNGSNMQNFSFTLYPMHMGDGTTEDKMLFLWPTMTYHVINESSPLYDYGKDELEKSDLEFILVAEGVVESTGLIVQTRTSYLSREVLWGYRFQPMNFCEMNKGGNIVIQYKDFNKMTEVIETPLYSSKELDERRGKLSHPPSGNILSSYFEKF